VDEGVAEDEGAADDEGAGAADEDEVFSATGEATAEEEDDSRALMAAAVSVSLAKRH
jgi:hypothetical protein